VRMLLEFQSSAFDRSAISPHQGRAGYLPGVRQAIDQANPMPAD